MNIYLGLLINYANKLTISNISFPNSNSSAKNIIYSTQYMLLSNIEKLVIENVSFSNSNFNGKSLIENNIVFF